MFPCKVVHNVEELTNNSKDREATISKDRIKHNANAVLDIDHEPDVSRSYKSFIYMKVTKISASFMMSLYFSSPLC